MGRSEWEDRIRRNEGYGAIVSEKEREMERYMRSHAHVKEKRGEQEGERQKGREFHIDIQSDRWMER